MSSSSSRLVSEQPMPRNQYGIVETCFEEGQYEAGINVLNALRDPRYKPPPSQIRQLLYLALYPTIVVKDTELAVPDAGRVTSNEPKLIVRRAENRPDAAASEAACRLLMPLAHTNSPEALLAGLPSYAQDPNRRMNLTDACEDSLVGKASHCIEESKDVWMILREGFIQHKPLHSYLGKKGKGKMRAAERALDSSLPSDEGEKNLSIVSDNAWPVLDWLITLFELDERQTVSKGLPLHSPLLLTQIPNYRKGPQWEAVAPLDIVFYCLKQTDDRRQTMGRKLFDLLINLSSTVHLNLPMFLVLLCDRLSSLNLVQLSNLLGGISRSTTGQRFKVAICRKYLTDILAFNDAGSLSAKSAPAARAQPRAARAARRRQLEESLLEGEPAVSIESKHPLPPSSEVIRLLEQAFTAGHDMLSSVSLAEVYRIKFEFLFAYGSLQKQLSNDERDDGWQALLTGAALSQTIDLAFGSGLESSMYREVLRSVIASW